MNNQKKNYKNYIADYLVCFTAAILIIVIFCVYFYNVFVKFQINYIRQYNKNVISKAYDFQNDLMTVSNSLFKDKNINLYMNNQYEVYNETATKTIKSILSSSTLSSMLKDVAIKNEKGGIIYSTLNEKKENIEDFNAKYPELSDIISSDEQGFNIYFYQVNSESTLIYSYNDYRGYTIYTFVDERGLRNHLFSNVYPLDCDMLLMDGENLLTSNISKSNVSIFKEAADLSEDSVRFGGNTLIVKTTSKKYSSISSIKLSAIFKEAISTGSFLMLFAALILILILIITYFFYYKQKKLISSHLTLMNKHIDTSVKHILKKLFNRDVLTNADESVLNEYFQLNGGNYFLPAVVGIANYNDLIQSLNYDDITIYKYGFENIINEVIGEIAGVKTSNMGKELIGVLIYSETPFDYEALKLKTKYFEGVIQKNFEATLFTVIGKEVEDIISAYEQIPTLINAQNYKFINNENEVLLSEISESGSNAEYPIHIQAEIITAVNSKNPEAFNDGVLRFADYIIKNNSLSGKEWFLKLFLSISDSCHENSDISISYNTLDAMIACDKISDIADLLSNSVKFLNISSNEVLAEVTDDFDSIVKKAIEDEFANPDFCIQSITERFGFTASYFGKKFKHNFNMSFNKYLLDYRLNHAVKLLRETDYTNTKIAELCGFNSGTYFITIFKKNMGISPKEYKNKF